MPEISDEEYATYQQFQQLGDFAEVQNQLNDYRKILKERNVSEAAKVSGFNEKALGKLLGEMDVTVKDTENGKQAFILQGEEEVSLQEYAEQEWSDFLPALAISSATTVEKDKDKRNLAFIPQRPSGASKKKEPPSVVQSYIQRTYQFDKE